MFIYKFVLKIPLCLFEIDLTVLLSLASFRLWIKGNEFRLHKFDASLFKLFTVEETGLI